MKLIPLTNGKVSGTGTLELSRNGGMLGQVLISTDNSTAAAVLVHADNASGEKIFDISTVTAGPAFGPVAPSNGTNVLYFDVSGSNASAQFFEWVN
mgnify:CR=1 FL=1